MSAFVMLNGIEGHYWIDAIHCNWNYRHATDCSESSHDDFEECDHDWDRIFLVYKLDSEQERIERENHALFSLHVGTHTEYDSEGMRCTGDTKPYTEHHKFYNVEKPVSPPLRENQVIGWYLR